MVMSGNSGPFNSLYGQQQAANSLAGGMGSLQNLSRSTLPLAQQLAAASRAGGAAQAGMGIGGVAQGGATNNAAAVAASSSSTSSLGGSMMSSVSVNLGGAPAIGGSAGPVIGGGSLGSLNVGMGLPQLAVGGGRISPPQQQQVVSAIGVGAPGMGSYTSASAALSAQSAAAAAAVAAGSSRQSTMGMNLLQTTSRNPLFSRESRKIDAVNTFDPSEFPSLGNRDNSAPNQSLGSRPNYVGMVKQPAVLDSTEFQMSNEDFPALPGSAPYQGLGGILPPGSSSHGGVAMTSGISLSSTSASLVSQTASLLDAGGDRHGTIGLGTQVMHGHVVGGGAMGGMMGHGGSGPGESAQAKLSQLNQGLLMDVSDPRAQQLAKRGIQTSPDGRVANIPGTMVRDQFGMIGLLTFIRAAETDPNLVSLALGADLTTLGLNLNSEVNLHPTFGGPWAETPCRPQDIDFHVPHEYLTNTAIRDKLAPVKLNRYKDDVLFYMFYTNVGDVLQLAAAAELYNRDWRYHKEDRVWITRAPGMAPSEKTQSYERGTYYFFDVTNWRKVPKDFHLDYDKLEDRPSLPTHMAGSGGAGGGASPNGPASSSPQPPTVQGLPPQQPPGLPPQQQHSPISQSSATGAAVANAL